MTHTSSGTSILSSTLPASMLSKLTYIPWTLAAGLENLTLLGSAAFGVGNASNNVITGNDAEIRCCAAMAAPT